MSEEVSIPLTNIIICIIYLLPRLVTYSRATAYVYLPIFKPLFCFLQRLGHILWCLYWGAPWGESVRAGEPAAGPRPEGCRPGAVHRESGTTNTAEARLNTANPTRNQGRKRKRKGDDEKGPAEQIQKLDSNQSSNPFACPFYLYDRQRWHNCLRNYTLNRIVDVRLHLTRAHSLGPQCPICGEEFREGPAEDGSAEDRFNEHVQRQTCQSLPNPPPPRNGLTRDQFESVQAIAKRRNGRRASDPAAEKWFEIWDIIFPGTPHPFSPYINDHPDVQRIRDMNDDILAGEQWRNLTAPTRGSSPSLQNASRNTIRTITERLLTFYRSMYEDPDQAAPEGVSNTAAAGTPVTSSMDDLLQQQQQQGWELISAPGQPAQPLEDLLPPEHPAAAAAGHDQWAFQQPQQGFPSLSGQSHVNTVALMSHPLPLFTPDMGFFADTHNPESTFGYPDVDDPLWPPARDGSPSQFLTDDYGSNTSGIWGEPSGDGADEA